MSDAFLPIWNHYRAEGLDAAARAARPSRESLLYLALLAFADERYTEAAAFADGAARASPEELLPRAAATYLARVAREGKRNVYVSAEGFRAFIRGGGNVPLYEETSAVLARCYPSEPFDLLDIGVGDGMALLPALTPAVRQLTLVEPAAPLLERTTQELATRGVGFETFAGRLQEFVAEPGMQPRRAPTSSTPCTPSRSRSAPSREARSSRGSISSRSSSPARTPPRKRASAS